MQSFTTNDGVSIRYTDTGSGTGDDVGKKDGKPWLILIHGFTGSSLYWQHSIPVLSKNYRVIAPDLRGHGESDKPKHGFHVARLAMDLRELIVHLSVDKDGGLDGFKCSAIGGSLGCSILWSYAELFTTSPFTHMVFVDQSPLQNSALDGWDTRFCNRGMNNPDALLNLQRTLATNPTEAHKGTISACLSYLSHPSSTHPTPSPEKVAYDEEFFLAEALKGDANWFGKLMADHTALDWRSSIIATFGPASGSQTKVLVVSSSRSGCFESAGPLRVVEFVNGNDDASEDRWKGGEMGREGDRAKGVVVDWGGHWCFWEEPEKFNELVLEFLLSSS